MILNPQNKGFSVFCCNLWLRRRFQEWFATKWVEIDQDNLRTGTARLSRVSWALLKLLVYFYVETSYVFEAVLHAVMHRCQFFTMRCRDVKRGAIRSASLCLFLTIFGKIGWRLSRYHNFFMERSVVSMKSLNFGCELCLGWQVNCHSSILAYVRI